MKLRALALCLTASSLLVGCGNFTLFPGVHKIHIQQGNYIRQDMIDKLEPGMTRSQVRFVLGTPLVADTFNQDRWDYYYSMDDQEGNVRNTRFSVFFEDDVLTSFEGNLAPEPEE